MISIDTGVLRDLVRAASSANDEVTKAAEILNSITVHNDWSCREKSVINEYTSNNRNRINRIKENTDSFLSTLVSVTEDFEKSENSISSMFGSVESVISGIVSIPIIAPDNIPGISAALKKTISEVMDAFMKRPSYNWYSKAPAVTGPGPDLPYNDNGSAADAADSGFRENQRRMWETPVVTPDGQELYIFGKQSEKIVRNELDGIFDDLKTAGFGDLAL